MQRDARREAPAGALWSLLEEPKPKEAPADDPFTELLDADEAHETLVARIDQAAELRELFAASPPAPAHEDAPPVRPGGWPTHNYGPAYDALRTNRRLRRRTLSDRHEADLWDIDEAFTPPAPPPRPAVPAPVEAAPWPTPAPQTAQPLDWLDTLDRPELEPPLPTEARLVSTLFGDRRTGEPSLLLDATDVLFAHPRKTRTLHVEEVSSLAERVLRGAAVVFLVLFALAVLQLLLS